MDEDDSSAVFLDFTMDSEPEESFVSLDYSEADGDEFSHCQETTLPAVHPPPQKTSTPISQLQGASQPHSPSQKTSTPISQPQGASTPIKS